ncbi:MAG: DNA repair protein RadC [Bacteroidota bacterium]|nr:DNA repair protein RadC [Bacteroidota bacterium]
MEGTRNLSIRCWPAGERPRERLFHLGVSALSDAELLAVLIHTGAAGRNALEIARELLAAYGSLARLSHRPTAEIRRFRGLGTSRAASLAAAFEIGRRTAAAKHARGERITGPEDVAHRYIPLMRDLPKERFVALLLNNSGRIINECLVSEGTVNASIVHPREVFHAAVTELATAVILLHNHPSGVRMASREDHAVTRRLIEAGRVMDIPVRDHIIICGDEYISFAENGWLDTEGNVQ